MKFVLAAYGTRGDIEPCVVLGRELQRRGHDLAMAVPPNLVGDVEGAGLAAVAYGLDSQALIDTHRDFWTSLFRNFGISGKCAGCGTKCGTPASSRGRR